MDDIRALARHLIAEKAVVAGDFLLSSGQRSDTYFDKYQILCDGRLVRSVITDPYYLPEHFDLFGGLETGGIIFATALMLETRKSMVVIRKEPKTYGTCKRIEGDSVQGKNVLPIEDVVTSGKQLIQGIEALRSEGAQVDYALCIVLREEQTKQRLQEMGVTLIHLYTMQELVGE